MSRQARTKSYSKIYHIVQSGLYDRAITETDADKNKMIEIIIGRQETLGFEILAYSILDDHFHLLIKEDEVELSRIMQCVQVRYAKYFNTTYGTIGPVFKDRYQSEPIENVETLKAVVSFINHTPLKNGVSDLINYKWSSYGEYVKKPDICNVNVVLNLFSDIIEVAIKKFELYSNEINEYSFLEMKICTNALKLIKGTIEGEEFIKVFLDKYNLKLEDLKLPFYKEERNSLIVYLKNNSTLSIRNISSLLDIGRSIVERSK